MRQYILNSHTPSPKRSGFVLLITLVLLTLAALAMIAVSRAALLRSMAAREAQQDLQSRWGTLSCQKFLLPQCPTVLQRAEAKTQAPVSIWRNKIMLGGQSFFLTFQDESAKANVGTLIQQQGLQQAEETIRRLSLGSSQAAGNVHLRFSRSQNPESFGEVFDGDTPQILFDHELGPAPAEVLTCWSNGMVNIHRTTEPVMREACVPILNFIQIHQLAELQRTDPKLSVAEAIARIQVDSKHLPGAEKLLTSDSTCFSLWIECRTERRSYWSLNVIQQKEETGPLVCCFEW